MIDNFIYDMARRRALITDALVLVLLATCATISIVALLISNDRRTAEIAIGLVLTLNVAGLLSNLTNSDLRIGVCVETGLTRSCCLADDARTLSDTIDVIVMYRRLVRRDV